MKIRTIRLFNGYKRFHDLTLDLGEHPKKIIALVGPNGCGKSSIFDGMIFHGSRWGNIGGGGGKDSSFHSMTNSPIDQSSIEIMFDNGQSYAQIRSTKSATGDANTIFTIRSAYRHNSELNVRELKAIADIKDNNIGASYSVDLDSRIEANYQRLYSYLDSYRKQNDLTDRKAKEHIIGELNTALSECLDLTLSDCGDIIGRNGTLFFTKTNQPEPFLFNVLSAGEKEVVDILLDIFLKRNVYTDTVYLIDEPELHLNTGIQKKLLIEIEKLIPDNCQLWVATHSLGFLNALQNELNDKSDIIHFKGDFSTQPVTLRPIEKSRVAWQEIFQTALDDLTGLIAPEVIIYCEGHPFPSSKGQDKGFDAKIYNKIFERTHPKTLFVSSGGHTEQEKYAAIALSVLNKAFSSVEILILKDKDINSDGTPTTDSQRSAFLAQDAKNRMLERKEIEDYILDFEIIEKAYPAADRGLYDAEIAKSGDMKSKAGAIKNLYVPDSSMNKESFMMHLASFITPDTAVYTELSNVIFQA